MNICRLCRGHVGLDLLAASLLGSLVVLAGFVISNLLPAGAPEDLNSGLIREVRHAR